MARYVNSNRAFYSDRIRALLAEHGPMCARELMGEIPGIGRDRISSILHRLRRLGDVHIARWERNDFDGTLTYYPRPYYALGAGEDALRPKPLTGKQYEKRRRAKDSQRARVPVSVFDMGAKVSKRYYTKDMRGA